jgi:minor extracellular serine protease Vpr
MVLNTLRLIKRSNLKIINIMKRITLIFMALIIFSQITNAQINVEGKKVKKSSKAHFIYKQSKKCSPYTALLLSNLKQTDLKLKRSAEYLTEHFNLIKSNNETYVSAFIKTDGNLNKSLLTEYGVKLNTQAGNIYTSLIPLNQLENVLLVKGVEYVEIGHKVEAELDDAKEQTWVNWVHNGTDLSQAYTGDGVIVGIIDGGFDYTHPTFYNADHSQYRISRVWEQSETGTPPSGYSYGNELVGQSAILNDGYSSTTGSHGTHVAGIATGSGSALSTYKGIAFNSEMIFVATDYSNVGITDGIRYMFDYADKEGKPIVVNMSLGGQMGPHDGTSLSDQTFDDLTGEGKILIGSAGNDGNDNLHLNYDFGSDETIYSFLTFPENTEHPSAGSTFIDIWGEAGNDFTVAVNVYNVDANQYEDYTDYISTSTDGTYNFTLQDSDPLYSDEVIVSVSVEHSNPHNGKPHVYIWFDNTDQDESGDIFDYIMLEVNGTNTSFDAWTKGVFSDLGYLSPLINGNTNSTISENKNGNSIITVGAYTSKNEYTDFQGNTHNVGFYTEVGEIAPFSSLGPTADGRTKPDITAPGNVIISSVNSFDANYTSTNPEVVANVNNGTDYWWFASMQGTSMASPMVTGIVALWLEANPTLTPAEIKQLMQNNAWTDSYTGSVPNNTWGNGKIDAHETIKAIEQQTYNISISVSPINSGTTTGSGTYTNSGTANLTATPETGYDFINWTDDGTEVSTNTNYSFTVYGNRTLTANFEIQSFDISASVNPANSGTISGTGNFNYGQTANLTATPQSGYVFVDWTENGTQVSTNINFSFTVTENRTLVANFTASTGIDDIESNDVFTLYPNPTNGLLNIQSPTISTNRDSDITINLIDNLGKKHEFLIKR